MPQIAVAEVSSLSECTCADMERGKITLAETILRICSALQITPDKILTDGAAPLLNQAALLEQFGSYPPKARKTALKPLSDDLDSVV
jgi:hypothetical protein